MACSRRESPYRKVVFPPTTSHSAWAPYAIWPSKGLSLTLGGRIDGVPVNDAVGGSDGFRRAGYAIYVDPGVNWVFGKNILSVNVPVAVERNLQASPYLDNGVVKSSAAGAFADYIVVAAYSRRF